MKSWARDKQSGFTIVELLIVIVVIGILATITIVAYNGIQERARQSKIDTDLSYIEKAVRLAQTSGQTLRQITDETGTGHRCWEKPAGTDLSTLPKTDDCWVMYNSSLQRISEAAGADITSLVDPWGYPYMIDENEGENPLIPCQTDDIGTYKHPVGGDYSSTVDSDHVREVYPIGSDC